MCAVVRGANDGPAKGKQGVYIEAKAEELESQNGEKGILKKGNWEGDK